MAFTYYTPFTIASSQFAGSLTDFPVLIRVTDNRFRTIANGGHVADANGYDIRPYDNSGLSTGALSYQLVPGTYDGGASAGTFEMYVKVASATSGSSTIYLGYGDAALNTDGSSVAAWNSAYKGVWHLPNGSSLTAADGTTNANNGTVNNATAGTGQVDGCAVFNGTTADITVGTGSSLNITTLPITIEGWVKKNASTTVGPIFGKRIGGTGYAFAVRNAGVDVYFTKAGVVDIVFPSLIGSNTNWYYVAVVCDSTSARCYVNPTTNSASNTQANTQNISSNGSTARIGYDAENTDRWTGSIDELRISNATRSGDWLLASYNNQLAPSTFAPTGTEVAVGGGAAQWGQQTSDQWNRIVQGGQ